MPSLAIGSQTLARKISSRMQNIAFFPLKKLAVLRNRVGWTIGGRDSCRGTLVKSEIAAVERFLPKTLQTNVDCTAVMILDFFEQNLLEIVYDDEGLFGFWAEAGNICLGPKSFPVLILLERPSRILRNIDSHSPRVELGEPEVKDFFFQGNGQLHREDPILIGAH